MLAVALRATLRTSLHTQRKSFVSSVLLSKTWENETVAALKKEAKTRGLSTKGNKTSLVLRIQEHERLSLSGEQPSSLTPSPSTRNVSTGARMTLKGEAPGKPSATSPPQTESFFKVILPDISEPEPEPPVQVPYVPDLWNSEQVTESIEAAATGEDAPTDSTPKLVVVAGESTHHAGGPSHNLVDDNAIPVETQSSEPISPPAPAHNAEQGFWADVAEDLGLPKWKDVKKGFGNLF